MPGMSDRSRVISACLRQFCAAFGAQTAAGSVGSFDLPGCGGLDVVALLSDPPGATSSVTVSDRVPLLCSIV